MKIAPLSVRDPWYGRMLNNRKVHADALKAVPVETVVEMELVELLHGGPETNYRPYLHLRGELVSVVPSVELPYGVTELPLPRGGQSIDAFYDFNDPQLADLVNKGYFTEAFAVPEAMSGIPWTLPGAADFLVVAPELENDAPVVFMNVHDQHSLELDEANSGYELADYFPDYTADALEQHDAQSEELQRSESTQDMFSDVEFEEHVPVAEFGEDTHVQDEGRREVPDGVFSRLVAEIESKRTADEPVVEEQPEVAETVSGWDVYMSRVAPGVDRVLAGEHLDADDVEPTEQDAGVDLDTDAITPDQTQDAGVGLDSDGFLSFSDEPEEELTPLSDRDEHEQAAARRAARLRAELSAIDDAHPGDEAQPTL